MSSLANDEAQWQDVFNIYDSDKDGKITKSEFVSAVRVLGRRYTATQMEDKMKTFGDTIMWDHFYGFMCDPYTGPTPQDLENALRGFDGKDCGILTVSQLNSLLTTMGDKMPPGEVAPVLDALPNEHGKASIADIVEYLTPGVPSTTPNIPELLREVMKEEVKKSGMADELRHMPAAPEKPATETTSAPAASEDGGEAAPATDEAFGDEVQEETHSSIVDEDDL